jgi:DNA-binding PadR family transcriptional regulator
MNIRTLCLGILQFEDATGYEINKLVADGRFSHFIEASYGSIYPALTKMMEEELVTCRAETQEGKPSRKIYSITQAGRRELLKALGDAPQPNRFKSEFLFVGLFADLIPNDHMKKVVELHEQRLSDKLGEMRQCYDLCEHAGSRFALGYGIAANEAALQFLKHNKKLLLETETIQEPDANREKVQ